MWRSEKLKESYIHFTHPPKSVILKCWCYVDFFFLNKWEFLLSGVSYLLRIQRSYILGTWSKPHWRLHLGIRTQRYQMVFCPLPIAEGCGDSIIPRRLWNNFHSRRDLQLNHFQKSEVEVWGCYLMYTLTRTNPSFPFTSFWNCARHMAPKLSVKRIKDESRRAY